MRSIQEKTCLSRTKAGRRSWTVLTLVRSPPQRLSSTHRPDFTASTNVQCTETHLCIFLKKMLRPHHSMSQSSHQLPQKRTSAWPFGLMQELNKFRCAAQRSGNIVLLWPFFKDSSCRAASDEDCPTTVMYVNCRPFVTSCKSCST